MYRRRDTDIPDVVAIMLADIGRRRKTQLHPVAKRSGVSADDADYGTGALP